MNLSTPVDLLAIGAVLVKQVSDYRDHHVTHDTAHGFRYPMFDATGQLRVAKHKLGTSLPVSGVYSSGVLPQLMDNVLRYMALIFEMMRNNRTQSCLVSSLVLASE